MEIVGLRIIPLALIAATVIGLCAPVRGQLEAATDALAAAEGAHREGRSVDAVLHLHRAATAIDAAPEGEARNAATKRLDEYANDIDPRLASRRAAERESAAALTDVARTYLDHLLPQCAEYILRDAILLDPASHAAESMLRDAFAANSKALPIDKQLYHDLRGCFHPWTYASGIIKSPRLGLPSKDPLFVAHLAARGRVASRLGAVAESYATAGHHEIAFQLLNTAITIEPESTWPTARKIGAAYRESLWKSSEGRLADLWKNSKRIGKWAKPKGPQISPPDVDDRPALLTHKDALTAPFRLQVDITLEQQPAGGGLVLGATTDQDYFAVELNTIGQGISVYVSRTQKGDRKVIGGACMSRSSAIPEPVTAAGEPLYNALGLGTPTTLVVSATQDEIVVSSLLGQICRVPVEPGAANGAFGLIRVPYSPAAKGDKRRRSRTYELEFSNLIVD